MISPQTLIDNIKQYDDSHVDSDVIKKAYIFALECHGTQIRDSGDPYFSHPLEVASILIELKMDQKTVIAGLLHDTVEDTSATISQIKKEFGSEVAKIVDGVTKLSKFEMSSIAEKQTENFKKLLISAASDIRVLIIKLVDRLHNMRTLKYRQKNKRIKTARETLEIYAPLAERVGISTIKDELQDIAFMELYPDMYNSIKIRLKNLYETSEHIISSIASKLNSFSAESNIKSTINGRLKTPYSIWQKMNKRNISFEQLSDIMAFRIIVDTVPQCYQMLGLIHRNYLVVPGRFRDYISTPKNNGYQSLHTSVIGPFNKRIEIQIRTKSMHQISEHGVAAHWNYKESGVQAIKHNDSYQWLKNLVEILENTSGIKEFLENSKNEMLVEQIFCITPKGKIISLPRGASALDFAYAIHSEVGNHAASVKVNGVNVPLKTTLENGDQVEIKTDPNQVPQYSWESYVTTMKAKTSIQKTLNNEHKERNVIIGKSNLEEFFITHNITLSDEDYHKIIKHLSYENTNKLFQSIGTSETTVQEILSIYRSLNTPQNINQKVIIDATLPICGIPDLPTLPVNCCSPVPGDRVVGVLLNKIGVEIHLEHCEIAKNKSIDEDTQLIDLSWTKTAFGEGGKYLTKISITVTHAAGNLSKIANVIEQKEANIVNLKIGDKFENFVNILLEVEVRDIAHLSSVQAAIRSCDFVTNIAR